MFRFLAACSLRAAALAGNFRFFSMMKERAVGRQRE
jgi:hypothetical protein